MINPITNEKLDIVFLQRFKLLYYNGHENPFDQVASTPSNKQSGGKDVIKEVELAPGLLDIIQKKISECEGEIKDDELDEDGRCRALSEKTQSVSHKNSNSNKDDTDNDTDTDDDSVFSDASEFSPASSTNNTPESDSFTSQSMCHHCTNPIEHEHAKIKSIQHDGTNYNEAHFCNTKCFENNDFKLSKKSSKKGGRKKTTDK